MSAGGLAGLLAGGRLLRGILISQNEGGEFLFPHFLFVDMRAGRLNRLNKAVVIPIF